MHLRAVVTYYDALIDPRRPSFFVHDESGGIFVALSVLPTFPVHAGMLVEVIGVSGAGDFAPILDRAHIEYLANRNFLRKLPWYRWHACSAELRTANGWKSKACLRSVHESKWDLILNIAMNEGSSAPSLPKWSGGNYR